MTTDEDRDGPARDWTVMLRLAIDSDNADAARAVNEQVLHAMDVVAGAEPQLQRSASTRPCWYVYTSLDLSRREPIAPDDAPTRFKLVIRSLPQVPFMGQGDSHHGLWEWLPDSWGLAMASQGRRGWKWLPDSWGQPPGSRWVQPTGKHLFPHPAVRAAGVLISEISEGTTENL